METVRRGAEEVWVVWCLGNTDEYRGGALHTYIQMLEMAAHGSLHRDLAQIRELNEAIRAGHSPFGQREPIRLHLIRPDAPLPLDPELYLGRVAPDDLMTQGYGDAMRYLESRVAEGLPLHPDITRMRSSRPGLRFNETLEGYIALDQTDPQAGSKVGVKAGTRMALQLTIHIADLERFVDSPAYAGRLYGEIDFPPFGGRISCPRGSFNLLDPDASSGRKRMHYEVEFQHQGEAYCLAGYKELHDDPGFDLWADTTTLYVQLHKGRDSSGPVVGAGVLKLGKAALLRLLSTLRATATEGAGQHARALAKFGRFFLGHLWSSYAASSEGER